MIKIFNSKLNDVVMNIITTLFFMIMYLLYRYISEKITVVNKYRKIL